VGTSQHAPERLPAEGAHVLPTRTGRLPFRTVVPALPSQPADVAWPTTAWPRGEPGADVDTATLTATLDRLFAQPPELGLTLAVVAVHGGRVVAERYGPEVDAGTRLISWSTAKSVTAAAAGLLIGDGLLHLDEPVDVPEWRRDERARITMRHLLAMTPGLRFVEDYVDDTVSHCIDMLFGAGKDDVAAYAAALPLDHEPGTFWNYSSGTTNIVCRLLGAAVGGGEAGMRSFLDRRLFGPLGMASADPGFDAAGTFIGSSFLHATALDFARFGLPPPPGRLVGRRPPAAARLGGPLPHPGAPGAGHRGVRLRRPLVDLARRARLAGRPRVRGPVRGGGARPGPGAGAAGQDPGRPAAQPARRAPHDRRRLRAALNGQVTATSRPNPT
jgi:CubicO group peptidase (beta-lactamase class C family)